MGQILRLKTSDIVIMKNDLQKLVSAHKISKKLHRVILENMILRCPVVMMLLVLNFFGLTNIGWGVVLHEGMTFSTVKWITITCTYRRINEKAEPGRRE